MACQAVSINFFKLLLVASTVYIATEIFNIITDIINIAKKVNTILNFETT